MNAKKLSMITKAINECGRGYPLDDLDRCAKCPIGFDIVFDNGGSIKTSVSLCTLFEAAYKIADSKADTYNAEYRLEKIRG